jgi:ketosteroid isomerase-like protein
MPAYRRLDWRGRAQFVARLTGKRDIIALPNGVSSAPPRGPNLTDPINLPDVVAEVRAVFDRYEAALQANDIPVMEELFWNHATTTRYGVGENLQGWQAISDFRRSGKLGPFRRTLFSTVITTYGRDFATANTEYQRDGEATSGRETKTLMRTDDGWRIVSAHASLLGVTV